MEPALEIVYRDRSRSGALEDFIRQQADGLARECHELCGCRVTLEHPRGGCRVRLEMLTAPGEQLTAERCPDEGGVLEQDLDRLFADARQQLCEASARYQSVARERRMALQTAL